MAVRSAANGACNSTVERRNFVLAEWNVGPTDTALSACETSVGSYNENCVAQNVRMRTSNHELNRLFGIASRKGAHAVYPIAMRRARAGSYGASEFHVRLHIQPPLGQ